MKKTIIAVFYIIVFSITLPYHKQFMEYLNSEFTTDDYIKYTYIIAGAILFLQVYSFVKQDEKEN